VNLKLLTSKKKRERRESLGSYISLGRFLIYRELRGVDVELEVVEEGGGIVLMEVLGRRGKVYYEPLYGNRSNLFPEEYKSIKKDSVERRRTIRSLLGKVPWEEESPPFYRESECRTSL